MDIISGFEFGSLLISLLCIILGLFVGMLMGALPGLGLMFAITLLLPLSYNLSVMDSILLLLACYQGAEYGGSISAITLGIPGTAMASATVMDGHALAKNKSPGKALGYSITASTIGALFGGLVLILLSKPLSSFALQLGDPEYFLLGVLGLVAVSTIGSGDKTKNLISIVLGLIAGTIGLDIFTGYPRFTGNVHDLSEGINLIALVVALFAFTEVFYMVSKDLNHRNQIDASNLKTKLTFKELKGVVKAIWLGSMVGSFVGILPGLGSSASGWFGYLLAKKVSKDPSSFGKGSPEGIAAPESANNATVGGALLPLLTLGIPGSASLGIIAGAFIIHGVQPGPQIFTKSPELVNGIFIGFMVTAIIMYFMGRMMTTGFARILVTPNSFLVPSIVIFSVAGIFAASSSYFNLWFALILGVVAFYCRLLNYSIYSFVLAFVLSPIIEVGLRRSLVISDGSYSIFFTRTYSIILIVVMASFVVFAIYKWIKSLKAKKEEKDDNLKM